MAVDAAGVLDDLDGEGRAGPFTVQVGGRVVVFRPAAWPAWRDLMEAISWPPAFMALFGPDDPDDAAVLGAVPVWQMRAVLRGWRVHHGLCADVSENLRLAGMLSKPVYRAAAERDLREVHGLDLTVEWRSRRWRRLLNLLDGLPRTSHVSEAMAEDDELAEMYLRGESGAESRKARRRITEFSAEVELLSCVVDRLGDLLQAQAAGHGGRRRRVEPMPRPETAIQRAREKRTRRHHQFTVARVFGFIDAQGRPTGKGPAA